MDEAKVKARVAAITHMLEVTEMLGTRAAGLSPDNKQKVSLVRKLVRDDLNGVMVDEPITVIDPHLKWRLRSKLKDLLQRVRATMIYVTHAQCKALSFANQARVMQDGQKIALECPVSPGMGSLGTKASSDLNAYTPPWSSGIVRRAHFCD